MTTKAEKARQAVLAVWPKAIAQHWGRWRDGEEGYTVWTGAYKESVSIGGGQSESEAWLDAASNIPAAISELSSVQPVTCRCGCLIFVRENGMIVPHWNDPDLNGDQQKCAMNDKRWCDCHLHERQVCDICQGVPAASPDPSPTIEGNNILAESRQVLLPCRQDQSISRKVRGMQ